MGVESGALTGVGMRRGNRGVNTVELKPWNGYRGVEAGTWDSGCWMQGVPSMLQDHGRESGLRDPGRGIWLADCGVSSQVNNLHTSVDGLASPV